MESHRMIDAASLVDEGAVPSGTASLATGAAHSLPYSERAWPRYACYPAPERLRAIGSRDAYLAAVASRRQCETWQAPLSLYLHVPFGQALCGYSADSHGMTPLLGKALRYLSYLEREIALYGELFAGMNHVDQLHCGGGPLTQLGDVALAQLLQCIERHFVLAPDAAGSYAIDVDPATVPPERMRTLRQLGFNEVTFRLPDADRRGHWDSARAQPQLQLLAVSAAARAARFRSVNLAVRCGLPGQDMHDMGATLDMAIAAAPDCILLDAALPACELTAALWNIAVARLGATGYVDIGMGCFTVPGHPLRIAQQQGMLRRGMQGYTCHRPSDRIGCGVGAIGAVGNAMVQNEATLERYGDRIDAGQLPIARGWTLGMDDQLRRDLIERLMCNFALSIRAIEHSWSIAFHHYFSTELQRLEQLQAEGLLRIDTDRIALTPAGRLAVHHVCAVFDRYRSAA